MINHARTLLLNRSRQGRPPVGTLCEEYIPAGYRAVRTSAEARAVQVALFGKDPDFLYENVMLIQYMNALHSSDVANALVAGLDSRVTYTTAQAVPVATVVSASGLGVVGALSVDADRGRMSRSISVVAGGGKITASEFGAVQATAAGNVLEYAGVRLIAAKDGTWELSGAAVCTVTVADIVGGLDAKASLFSGLLSRADAVFRQLWREGQTSVVRLSGLLCALIQERHEALYAG